MSRIALFKENYEALAAAANLNIIRTLPDDKVHILNYTDAEGKEKYGVLNEVTGQYAYESSERNAHLRQVAAEQELLNRVIEENPGEIDPSVTIEKIHYDGKGNPVLLLKYKVGGKEKYRVAKPGFPIYPAYGTLGPMVKGQYVAAVDAVNRAPRTYAQSILDANIPLFFKEDAGSN